MYGITPQIDMIQCFTFFHGNKKMEWTPNNKIPHPRKQPTTSPSTTPPPPPPPKKNNNTEIQPFFIRFWPSGCSPFFKRVRRFLNKNFRVCFVFHNFFGGVGWTVQLRIDHHLQVGVAMGCLDTVAMELLARCDHIYSDGCAEIAADQARLAGLVGLAKLRLRCRWESLFFFLPNNSGRVFFLGRKGASFSEGISMDNFFFWGGGKVNWRRFSQFLILTSSSSLLCRAYSWSIRYTNVYYLFS